jgi:hypothetical protein
MTYTERYSKYSDWLETAKRNGYTVEQEGNKFIAHRDGIEFGCYDFGYGSVGFGWFEP